MANVPLIPNKLQTHIRDFLPSSVAGEDWAMELRQSLAGLHFNVTPFCLRYVVLEQDSHFELWHQKLVIQGHDTALTSPNYSLLYRTQ